MAPPFFCRVKLQKAATEISNNLVDQMVMGGQSQYEIYVRELVGQGMDEQSARKAAAKQFYLTNVGMAALGGAAAGGVMGGISQGIGYAQNRVQMLPTPEQGGHHLALGTAQDMAQQVAEITGATQSAEAVQAQKTAPMEGAAVKTDSDVYTVVSKLKESIPALSGMESVSTVSTQAIQMKNGKTMADRARGFFEAIKGTVTRAGFGDIEIDARSAKDDLNHGIGAAKAAVIPAIPHVIQKGQQIDFQQNWKGRGYDGYVFAAPVMMDGKPVYVAAVVKQSSKNHFYLHEVVDSNGNIIKINSGDEATLTSLAAESDAGTPSPLSSDPIIPSSGDGVNTEYAPPSGKDARLALGTAQDMAQQVAEITGATQSAEAVQAQKTAPAEGAGYRAVKPQNVEMPTVPLIDLSLKDIPGVEGVLPQTGEALRKDAIARARNRLGLDQREAAYIPVSNVQRDGNEYVLKITKSTLNKMLYPAAGAALPVESIVVMDNLERIANNGVYFKSEGDRDARPQIPGWDHLMTTVYIDGEPYSVDMRVKLVEEKPGSGPDNVLYYYSPEEIMTIEKVGPEAPTVERRALNMNSEPEPTSDPIIPSLGDGVNTEYAPPSGKDTPPADGDWASLAQQADTLFPAPPKMDEQSWDGLLQQADAMYPAKAEEAGPRENPFIPVRQATEDTRTAREKAIWEEAQRRKADWCQ